MSLDREQLDDLDYNDRYDATVAKGLCLECGGVVTPYWSLDEWFTPVWCDDCKFEINAAGAEQNLDSVN